MSCGSANHERVAWLYRAPLPVTRPRLSGLLALIGTLRCSSVRFTVYPTLARSESPCQIRYVMPVLATTFSDWMTLVFNRWLSGFTQVPSAQFNVPSALYTAGALGGSVSASPTISWWNSLLLSAP